MFGFGRIFADAELEYENKDLASIWQQTPSNAKEFTKKPQIELPNGWRREVENTTKNIVYIQSETSKRTYIDPRIKILQSNRLKEIARRFDSNATALDVLHGIDLIDKVAVITGANSGIGFETARALALHGCAVYFACRSRTRAEEAIARIRQENLSAGARCHFVHLDLASIDSVRNCVQELKRNVQHIDMLILNASLAGIPSTYTVDHLELTFQVSHVSHFHLTILLEDCLDYRSRVVVLSSLLHKASVLPLDGLNEQNVSIGPNSYFCYIHRLFAYTNAKLCNVLFGKGLAKRWRDKGTCVYIADPGNLIRTNIQKNMLITDLCFKLAQPFAKTIEQGASTIVYCATAPELTGITGLYYGNNYFSNPSARGQSEQLADNLWNLTETMIKRILSNK